MRTVLLTGATGSFGSELLKALCVSEEVEHIHALTHDSALATTCSKASAVKGDITQGEGLGVAASTVDELTNCVTGIVHAAADTRVTAAENVLRRANVDGTLNMLRFAERCSALNGFCLLSTVYVAGARTGTIFETELDHAAGFVNAYEHSKYEAELMARRWMTRIPLTVVRLSTVVGSPPAKPRPLGAIHQAVRLMYRSLAPMVPGSAEHPVDLVPVDYAAQAVAWLATRGFEASRTFHVVAGADTVTEAELLDLTMDTFAHARPAWRKRAIARPALVDLETFDLFRKSVDEVGEWVLRDSTAVISSFAPQLAHPKVFDDRACRRALNGSGIERSDIRAAYAQMVQQLIGAHS